MDPNVTNIKYINVQNQQTRYMIVTKLDRLQRPTLKIVEVKRVRNTNF